jgi:hypothetical protein
MFLWHMTAAFQIEFPFFCTFYQGSGSNMQVSGIMEYEASASSCLLLKGGGGGGGQSPSPGNKHRFCCCTHMRTSRHEDMKTSSPCTSDEVAHNPIFHKIFLHLQFLQHILPRTQQILRLGSTNPLVEVLCQALCQLLRTATDLHEVLSAL